MTSSVSRRWVIWNFQIEGGFCMTQLCSDKRLHVERDLIRQCWMKVIFLRLRQKPFINLVIHRPTVALLEDGEGASEICCSLEEEESN